MMLTQPVQSIFYLCIDARGRGAASVVTSWIRTSRTETTLGLFSLMERPQTINSPKTSVDLLKKKIAFSPPLTALHKIHTLKSCCGSTSQGVCEGFWCKLSQSQGLTSKSAGLLKLPWKVNGGLESHLERWLAIYRLKLHIVPLKGEEAICHHCQTMKHWQERLWWCYFVWKKQSHTARLLFSSLFHRKPDHVWLSTCSNPPSEKVALPPS